MANALQSAANLCPTLLGETPHWPCGANAKGGANGSDLNGCSHRANAHFNLFNAFGIAFGTYAIKLAAQRLRIIFCFFGEG